MTYESILYATRNETGEEQVELVYERGFWRWLLRMPNRKEVYVKFDRNQWREKETGKRANLQKQYEIITVIDSIYIPSLRS